MAIGHLHDRQIMYRNLKPSNIFLSNDHLPYLSLTDFDLASVMKPGQTGKTFENAVHHEANYIAPELYMGDPYDYQTDWWGVGVFCFHLIFGRLPFEHTDPYELERII